MSPLFYIVYWFHVILFLFTVFGCLLPKRFLIYHILVVCISFILRLFTGNKCVVSMLEDKLSGQPSNYDYKTPFLTHLGSLMGFHVEPQHSITITESITVVPFIISCVRLFILNK